MATLKVRGEQTISAIDNLFRSLERKKCIDLKIKRNIKKWEIGGKCALFQFILTWRQNCPESNLVTNIDSRDNIDKELKKAVDYDHILISFIVADHILSSNKNKRLNNKAYKYVRQELDKMDIKKGKSTGLARKGLNAFLICTDKTDIHKFSHFSPRHFYHHTGRVRDKEEFAGLISDIFSNITTKKRIPDSASLFYDDINPQKFNYLGSILYELFLNTHIWATTNHIEEEIEDSVRGIFIDVYQSTAKRFRDISMKSNPQRKFIENQYDDANSNLTFMEVSVFDSGPGLAAQDFEHEWDSNISLNDEFAACLRCLRKWETTTNESQRGGGLVNVMRNLTSLEGFWRVRTGRLNLCRNFADRPYREMPPDQQPTLFDDPDLVDWYSGDASGLTQLPRAEGVLSTMLIPLNRERK